MIGKEKTGLVI